MTSFTSYLAAVAALGFVASPAAAQYYPQQAYPQQGYPQQGYPQQGYSYGQQGYSQNPVSAIVNSLLGNRYNVSDREAVSQCASAAVAQAQTQSSAYGQRDNRGYGYNNAGAAMRVTAITSVQRRSNGLRVAGTMSSGGYGGQYGNQNDNRYSGQPGYQGYGQANLNFRCNVDNNGGVTGLKLSRAGGYGR